jgi:hypothetical protein
MSAGVPSREELLRAICEGAAVDWEALEGIDDESLRRELAAFRLVAEVAQVHRLDTTSTAPNESSTAPEVWGHLQVLEHIASGAFGDVYRAWDPQLDREVALKLLRRGPDTNAHDDEVVDEGRLLARVRHPHVVSVYGAARFDGQVGLWMEYLRGRTLAQTVEQDGALAPQRAVDIGIALCDALSAVHKAGLVHRDVKAQNVMLEDGGRVVLMDFGAGRDVRHAGLDIAGTPLYLAPEVARGAPATPQSDLFSLGILLRFAATGKYYRGEVPPRANPVLHTLLAIADAASARNPGDRPTSAEACGHALRELAAGRRWWSRLSSIALLLLASAASAGIGIWARGRMSTGVERVGIPPGDDYDASQVTFNSADLPITAAAISPDGRSLAYSDAFGVWIKDLDGTDTGAGPLEGSRGFVLERWLSDGESVVALSTPGMEGSRALIRAFARGKPARPAAVEDLAGRTSRDGLSSFEYTPVDGTARFRRPDGGVGPSFAVPPIALTPPPAWSPDGKYVVLAQRTQGHDRLVTIRVTDGEPQVVETFADSEEAEHQTWWSAGVPLIRFAPVRGGVAYVTADQRSLWMAGLDGTGRKMRESRRLLALDDRSNMGHLTGSDDGRRLAFTRSTVQRDVYIAVVERDGVHISNLRRLTKNDNNDVPVGWTSGDAVGFVSYQTGKAQLMRQRVADEPPTRLLSGLSTHEGALTPDGSHFLEIIREKGRPARLLKHSLDRSAVAEVLRDGQRSWSGLNGWSCQQGPYCVAMADQGLKRVVYRLDVDNDVARRMFVVSEHSVPPIALSPDGLSLAYVVIGGPLQIIEIVSPNGSVKAGLKGPSEPGPGAAYLGLAWAPRGNGLYVTTLTYGPSEDIGVWFVGLNGKTEKIGTGFDLVSPSPDGKFVALSLRENRTNAWILQRK